MSAAAINAAGRGQPPPSAAAHYLNRIRQAPLLEPEQEYTLAKSWRERGERDAAHRLVTSHLRLVVKIAAKYRGYGFALPELVAEGNVGLMQALDRFDPDRGFRFATYAAWWIKARIQENILRSWSLVRIGTTANQRKLFFKLRTAKSAISALDNGDLRPEQVTLLAARLSVRECDVIEMNRRLSGDSSLNEPIRDDGGSGQWQDWLIEDAPDQEGALAEHQQSESRYGALTDTLAELGDRERRIFAARRLAEDPISLEILSSEFGISRERVRQIELRAYEKVRTGVKSRMAAIAARNNSHC
jgi:RNA polymerase sigma-32 factor